MVVLLTRKGVLSKITNKLGVCSTSGVESEGYGDIGVDFEVPIDGLGSPTHLRLAVVRLEVLSKYSTVGVGVITADNDNAYVKSFHSFRLFDCFG